MKIQFVLCDNEELVGKKLIVTLSLRLSSMQWIKSKNQSKYVYNSAYHIEDVNTSQRLIEK